MGEALWDVFPTGKKIGGAPANFAFHAGQLGFDSLAISAVGRDALGDEIVDTFSRMGLNHLLARVDYPTGTVQVTLTGAGVPDFRIMEQVAWDNIPAASDFARLAAETSVFCFGSLAQRNGVSRAAICRFLELMPDDGDRLKVFDINLRQHFFTEETIASSLEKCNVLKLNDDEFERICQMFSLDATQIEPSCRELVRRFGLRYLVLTCGERGSYLFSQTEHSFCDTPRVAVADTVGAGDSFSASFCAAVLAGKRLSEAHLLAVEVAAFVCTQSGAMPTIPDALKRRLL